MTNGNYVLLTLSESRESLGKFLDWLIESKCTDAGLISAVSTSFCLLSKQHNKYAALNRKFGVKV